MILSTRSFPTLRTEGMEEWRSTVLTIHSKEGLMFSFNSLGRRSSRLELQVVEKSRLALALSLLIPIAILDTWFFSHELRNVRLDADEKAARLVGTREFLDVLEKVDSLRIWDIEERKKGGFRVTISSHFPAIDARIRRVRKLVEP